VLEIFQTIGIAVVMFAATNADDLVVLTIFFARPGCAPRQVLLGQLAGIGAVTAVSYTASRLALGVPHGWIPWLGIFPLLLGLRWLSLSRGRDLDAAPAASAWWVVAGVTMANGGDNLAVYIPAFAIQTGTQNFITAATFLPLTLIWCGLACLAGRHPAWGPVISRICNRAAPFVLIVLGLWIIAHQPIFGFGSGRF
jgi:cadmium resistance protein CadD (predicted permease)